jgi:hypothetical protein
MEQNLTFLFNCFRNFLTNKYFIILFFSILKNSLTDLTSFKRSQKLQSVIKLMKTEYESLVSKTDLYFIIDMEQNFPA